MRARIIPGTGPTPLLSNARGSPDVTVQTSEVFFKTSEVFSTHRLDPAVPSLGLFFFLSCLFVVFGLKW